MARKLWQRVQATCDRHNMSAEKKLPHAVKSFSRARGKPMQAIAKTLT